MNRNYYQALISMSIQQTDATGTVAFDIQGSIFSIKTSGNGIINWGDGAQKIVSGSDVTTSHSYSATGLHSIVFTGSFTNVQQVNSTQAAKVRKVWSYSLPSLTTAAKAFYQCVNATFDSGFSFGTSPITSLYHCFYECPGLDFTPNIPSTVEEFSYCFYNCTGISVTAVLPSVASNLNKSISFSHMYDGCINLLSIPSSNTRIRPNGKDMSYMFRNCSRLIADITSIVSQYENSVGINNTGNANAGYMFYNCPNLTGTMHSWWSYNAKFSSHSQCFYKCTGLANYISIPSGWKTS